MAFFDVFRPKNRIQLDEDDTESNIPDTVTESRSWNPFQNFKAPFFSEANINEDVVTDEGGIFHLSRFDRLLIFGVFLAGSIICYLICIFMFPVLSLKPRKFISLWTLGSIFFIVAFGFVQGFNNYMKHLFSGQRLVFTLTFFSSIALTIYSSAKLHNTLLAIIFAAFQLIAQIAYAVSYFPLGTTSLRFAGRIAANQAETWLNA